MVRIGISILDFTTHLQVIGVAFQWVLASDSRMMNTGMCLKYELRWDILFLRRSVQNEAQRAGAFEASVPWTLADNPSCSFLHVYTRFCEVIVHSSRQDVVFQLIGAILICTGL